MFILVCISIIYYTVTFIYADSFTDRYWERSSGRVSCVGSVCFCSEILKQLETDWCETDGKQQAKAKMHQAKVIRSAEMIIRSFASTIVSFQIVALLLSPSNSFTNRNTKTRQHSAWGVPFWPRIKDQNRARDCKIKLLITLVPPHLHTLIPYFDTLSSSTSFSYFGFHCCEVLTHHFQVGQIWGWGGAVSRVGRSWISPSATLVVFVI